MNISHHSLTPSRIVSITTDVSYGCETGPSVLTDEQRLYVLQIGGDEGDILI
jgi:hypothetical protein